MKKLFSRLEEALLHGEDVVLVTITASSGSTPQGAGARMLVSEQGLLAGTIGGGAVEHRCIEIARALVSSPAPVQHSFSLNKDDTADLGMICGGTVSVHFCPIPCGDADTIDLCRDAAARFAAGGPFWLLTPLHEGGKFSLLPKRGADNPPRPADGDDAPLSPKAEVRTVQGKSWFFEQIQQPGAVYLFGGGHVTQALVPVLAPLNFPCIVLEDRAEFADARLFPLARECRLVDFADPSAYAAITEDDYVCIMTRGHENDLLVQQHTLRTAARYIGLIGSVRKAAASFSTLRKMDFSERDLARIITPIGLALGGRSPAEIAISIAAQLIQYRAGTRQVIPPTEVLL